MRGRPRNYLIVTASYWGFTLVDGALAHAGAVPFLPARLLALHARVPVPALRSSPASSPT